MKIRSILIIAIITIISAEVEIKISNETGFPLKYKTFIEGCKKFCQNDEIFDLSTYSIVRRKQAFKLYIIYSRDVKKDTFVINVDDSESQGILVKLEDSDNMKYISVDYEKIPVIRVKDIPKLAKYKESNVRYLQSRRHH